MNEAGKKIRSRLSQADQWLSTHSTQLLGALFVLLTVSILISEISETHRQQAQTSAIRMDYQAAEEALRAEQDRFQELISENDALTRNQQAWLEDYLNALPPEMADGGNLRQDLNFNQVLAGSTEVEGEGIELILSDAVGIDYATARPGDIIHDRDVVLAVNLLKANGASAIAVNGERLVQSSKLVCNGPTILVNRRQLAAPFVFTAVGDSSQMMQAMAADYNLQALRLTGKRVEYSQSAKVTVPAFTDQSLIDRSVQYMKEAQE